MKNLEIGFDQMNWQFETIPERHALRAVFNGRDVSYQVFAMRLPAEGLYRFVILCPLQIEEQHLAGVAEVLHRLNVNLPLGAFELDYDQVTVRWVASAETIGDPIPNHWVGAWVQRGLTSFESIWPELLAVCEGRLSPVEATLRSQLAMEIAGIAHQHDGAELSLSPIDEGATKLRYAGLDAELLTAALGPIFGQPLPFELIAN